MPRTKRETIAGKSLYQIGYKYLHDHFHKFNERNKIKIALAILQIFEKDDSKTPVTPMQVTVVIEKENENQITSESGNRISQYIEI